MAFDELKAKHSVVWGSGPYERISEHLKIAHDHLLREVEPREGEAWLDVATGTGEIAVRAAEGGADVTGLDLAPDLIERARERASAAGSELRLDVGDAEALPYEDGSFDTISSSFGVMFAPDHEAVARELGRVCRSGARLGLLTWQPTAGMAEVFKVMAAYMPPPPEGAGSPFRWGDHGHVEELLGEDFELHFEEGNCPQPGSSAEEVWELFSTSYGPTKALANSLEPDKLDGLRSDWVAHYEQFRQDDGGVLQPRPYVLVLGSRR